MKTNQMRISKGYSELAMAKEPLALAFWQRLKGRGMGKLDSGKKGRLQVFPEWWLLARGNDAAYQKRASYVIG